MGCGELGGVGVWEVEWEVDWECRFWRGRGLWRGRWSEIECRLWRGSEWDWVVERKVEGDFRLLRGRGL